MGDIDHYHRLQHSHKGLKIASLTVIGTRGHHNELKHLVVNTGLHVLAPNETKGDNDVPDQTIKNVHFYQKMGVFFLCTFVMGMRRAKSQ